MTGQLLAALRTLGAELDQRDIDWAIGGAHAMAAHGFSRETKDIDVFVSPHCRVEVLQICADAAIPIEQVFAESHYTFVPNHSRPDERLDLLFVHAQPDIAAVMFPTRRDVLGGSYPVCTLPLIAVAKLRSDRAKDVSDLDALYRLGLIDTAAVHEHLEEDDDQEAIEKLRQLVARARSGALALPLPKLHRRKKPR